MQESLKVDIGEIVSEYAKNTPFSQKIFERGRKVIPAGVHRDVLYYKPYPVFAARAFGSHIVDVDGNDRIDYCFNFSSLILGHSNPAVISSITKELDNGLAFGQPSELEIKLAEKIVETVPCAEAVKFTVTGTEACMNAARAARIYKGRKKIVVFQGSNHGSSDSMAVHGLAFAPRGETAEQESRTIALKFNDYELLEKTLKEHKQDIAAVFLEPVQASGGVVLPKDDFVEKVREITRKMDILLVLDEIVTGFRISLGGWQERFGVIPDLVTLGKNLAGGMPGAAIAGSKEIMCKVYGFDDEEAAQSPRTRLPLSGTYNSLHTSMAAGLATLNQLDHSVYEKIDGQAARLRSGFEKLASELGVPATARGIGSIFQFHVFDRDGTARDSRQNSSTNLRWLLDLNLLHDGVYLAPNHFCVTSAATSDNDINLTLASLERSLSTIKSLISAS